MSPKRPRGFQVALGLPGLGGESVLLGAQKIDRHRARVIGVKELPAFLDQIDWHVALFTAGSLHPPDAEEVGIPTSIPFRLDQAHPRTASTAVERALQIVVMLSILLGGVVVGGEGRPWLWRRSHRRSGARGDPRIRPRRSARCLRSRGFGLGGRQPNEAHLRSFFGCSQIKKKSKFGVRPGCYVFQLS